MGGPVHPSWFRISFLLGLLTGLCLHLASSIPQTFFAKSASFQSPRTLKSQSSPQSVAQQQLEERAQVNTVSVLCHPDSIELVIQADLFAVGAPVDSHELRLGVEPNDYCRATASSADEYRILVGVEDCGTKHWMTEDSLVYTNLLIFSPLPAPNGITRMDEAVIPIECQYQRKYSLSSSSLVPTWIPFMSTQAAVETLKFNLRLMADDWTHERGASTFYLGEPIHIEASVRVGHHMGLRLFLSSCVATLEPEIYSDPKYIFIEDGCLVDSQLPGSRAHFLPRTQDEKLQLAIDSFKFHNDDRGQLYITCHLNAVPVEDAEAPNKACTFINGRWRSADGNDYLCGYCQNQNEASVVSGKTGVTGAYSPRGFGKPSETESMWRSGVKTNQVWEHDVKLGPVTVLPSWKAGPLTAMELPPVLHKIRKTALYGSHWRSGLNGMEKGQVPDQSEDEVEDYDDSDKSSLEFKNKSSMELDAETAFPTMAPEVETSVNNATAAVPDLSDKPDPKK